MHASLSNTDRDRYDIGETSNVRAAIAACLIAGTSLRHRLSVVRIPLLVLLLVLPVWPFAPAAAVSVDFPARTFYGEFTHTLYPELGPIPLFSRAAAKSNGKVKDAFGVWQDVFAGEARFPGANRVANLLEDSEGLTAGWYDVGTTRMGLLDTPNPLTPDHKSILLFTRTGKVPSTLLTLTSRTYQPLHYVFSLVIDGDNTSKQVRVKFVRSADAVEVLGYTVTPKPGANRYCFPFTPVDTALYRVEIAVTTAGVQQLAVGTAQMEVVNVFPRVCNNYVSKGVPGGSYPYHGAGVDGVAYFDTVNQWAYASGASGTYGLVTPQTPTPIDPALLKGILLEPASANKVLYNNTFTNEAWIKSGIALGDNASSPYGRNTLTKLVEDETAGKHGISTVYCSICTAPPASTRSTTVSAVVKPAERTWAYLEINSGANIVGYAYYNLLTGKVGNFWGKYANADIWKDGTAWRISLTVDAGDSWATYPGKATVNLYAAFENGVTDYQGFPGNGLYAGLMQWENNEMATSYIGDQLGAALTRKEDSLAVDLPRALASTLNLSVSLGITPWYYTGTPAKSSWYFIACGWYDFNNRFGLFFRPGSKGGMRDYFMSYIGIDYYSNSKDWNGAHQNYGMNYGTSTRAVFTFGPNDMSTAPRWGYSGSAMTVGGIYGATQTSESGGFPMLSYAALMPPTFYFGKGVAKSVTRHPMSYKQVSIFQDQMTKQQMLLESAAPQ